MNRAERLQRMLELIDERLEAYTVEETVERLNSYNGTGPTIREFYEGMHSISSADSEEPVEGVDVYSISDSGKLLEGEVRVGHIGNQPHDYFEMKKLIFDHVPHARHSCAIPVGIVDKAVMEQYYLEILRPATYELGLGGMSKYLQPFRVDSIRTGWEDVQQAAAHPGLHASLRGEFDLQPVYLNVDVMHNLSYPSSGRFIMGNGCWVEGRSIDTVFFSDAQEGSDSHEAA